MVYLLVDCSIPPQRVDLAYAGWLFRARVPFAVVFTKVRGACVVVTKAHGDTLGTTANTGVRRARAGAAQGGSAAARPHTAGTLRHAAACCAPPAAPAC